MTHGVEKPSQNLLREESTGESLTLNKAVVCPSVADKSITRAMT